jgi:hypothetical protein
MNLGEIYHGLINLAEAAHHLAREMLKYPHRDDVGHCQRKTVLAFIAPACRAVTWLQVWSMRRKVFRLLR